jgi:hypothetical protein
MKLDDKFTFEGMSHNTLTQGGLVYHSVSGYKPATFFDRPFLRTGSNEQGKIVRLDIFESMVVYPKTPRMVIEVVSAENESLHHNAGAK